MKMITPILAFLFLCFGLNTNAQDIEEEASWVDIHGFISQGNLKSDEYNYLAHDAADGSFQFNEMGINFSKQMTDKLRVGVQLFARDLGDVANDEITIDWAYGDYRWRDWLGLRVGKIKIPRGLYNETRDMDMLRTCIILPQGIYNELLRDAYIALKGVGVYGYIPIDRLGSIEYQALAGTVSMDRENGAQKYIDNALGILGSLLGGSARLNGEIDVDSYYAGSVMWNLPVEGLSIKISGFQTSAELPLELAPGFTSVVHLKEMSGIIYSAEYMWEDLSLAIEYYEEKIDVLVEALMLPALLEPQSYYMMASYRLTEWMEFGAYYSVHYADKNDKDGNTLLMQGLPAHWAWQKDLALSVRFDINEYWVFKLEAHSIDGTAQVVAVDNPVRLEKDWMLFAAKVTFSF